jgi:hypothetical protein
MATEKKNMNEFQSKTVTLVVDVYMQHIMLIIDVNTSTTNVTVVD